MDIQAEKKILMGQVAKLQDSSAVARVKYFLQSILQEKDEGDFWDDLMKEDQVAINEGIYQLDNGQHITHQAVRKEIKDHFKF